jgi:NADH:ubiquinone oxidoreductase subunit F (NADH-binding)
MSAGEGHSGDVEELKSLSAVMFDSSFCGLGQSVPIPMNSAMKNFEKAFERAET